MALENVMRVDNGNVVGPPAMPETYPAEQVIMPDGDSVENRLSKSCIYTSIDISSYNTENNPFICPRDGYIRVIGSSSVMAELRGIVGVGLYYTLLTSIGDYATLFMRKGAKVYVYNTTFAHFFPIK